MQTPIITLMASMPRGFLSGKNHRIRNLLAMSSSSLILGERGNNFCNRKSFTAPQHQFHSSSYPQVIGSNGLEFDSLAEMQVKACELYKEKPFLGYKPKGDNMKPFQWVSYTEFEQLVSRCRTAFAAAGIGEGDKVAVISANRLEWAISAYACFSLGAIYVPMYEQQRLNECEYILTDSGAKLLLVSKELIFDKTRPLIDKIPTLQDIWCFDVDYHTRINDVSASSIIPPIFPGKEDIATLIYTSGTTGTPKGVKLSHLNLTSNCTGMLSLVPDSELPDPRSLAFLPWAHCFGMTCELHNMLQRGAQVGIAVDISTVADNLKEVKPTILYSVPTLFKKVYDRVQEKVSNESAFKRKLIQTALDVADERREALAIGKNPGFFTQLKFSILDKIVLSKFREPFGGLLNAAYVGGSAMPLEVGKFFENSGISICEGYGLTETSPLICVNVDHLDERRLGTVGKLVPDVEVKIISPIDGTELPHGDEGEVWVRGPSVFKEYHKKPEETAATFGEFQGKKYFKSGDLGMFVDGKPGSKLLKITGRIKELYKLENGKYVAPGPIEKLLAGSDLLAQTLLFGDNRPYNILILVPNWEKITAVISSQNNNVNSDTTVAELADLEDVQNMIDLEVMNICKDKLKKFEMPSKVLLIGTPFSVEDNLLTPKLSIKRHNVVKKYDGEINELYSSEKKFLFTK